MGSGPVERLTTYWEHLENDRFEEAAAQFAEDTVYLHPPSHQGITDVYGRENLLEYFREARGPRDSEHIVDHVVREGDDAVVHGRAVGSDIDGVHVFAVFVTAESGRIDYYHAVNREEEPGYSPP